MGRERQNDSAPRRRDSRYSSCVLIRQRLDHVVQIIAEGVAGQKRPLLVVLNLVMVCLGYRSSALG